eukprot:GGOE01037753.1.p1 GENE.GGOE01037753.1~~GGOE01037753.1.p1  ORF type:complete len:755 (+),score=188.66 GGOE01037753.1:78-2342(+)
MMRAARCLLSPPTLLLVLGAYWAVLPLLYPRTMAVLPTLESQPALADPLEALRVHPVETIRLPLRTGPPPRSNLTRPFKEFYFPRLYPSVFLHNLPCVGIWERPVPPPKPLPKNPRFVLLVDSWERQQTGTKTMENAATIVERFGLVFVVPHVRMSNIQGVPGWTQWMSTHALDGFTSAKYLLNMEEYYDLDFTRGYLPLVSFEDFLRLSNDTITTALMLDWDKDHCRGNKPEWFPAFGARIQVTQLQCMPADFPSTKLNQQVVDRWFTPGQGQLIPEAQGRSTPPVPSVAFLNWRKHSFGSHVWDDSLWGGKCRFRWNRKWNATAVEWATEHLPDRYVAIKIRSGDFLREFWLPKSRDDVQICFDHMVDAAKYYLRALGLPEDAPVFLSTEWPNPPESRIDYNGVSYLTAAFNSLYRALNVVTFRSKELDLGIVTIISFNLLLNAAVVVAFEDTMVGFVRQYRPAMPLAIVGGQSERKCNNWNPPKDARPPQFLYLVQGRTFAEQLRYSDDADTICLTWGTPVSFCIHRPNTTWTSGRNVLWQLAVKRPRRYEYYVFLDDDVSISGTADFERLLLKWRPAIGVPAGAAQVPDPFLAPHNESEAIHITAFHGYANAFHRDVFFNSLVLPFYDGMDHFSWWTSQLYASYLAAVFHPEEVFGFPQVSSGNWFVGKYPQRWDLGVMDAPFVRDCIPDDAFRAKHWHGFAVRAVAARRAPSGSRSHILSPETMRQFLTLDTPYWRRVRSVREEALGPL